MDTKELAWASGLFEGEGCITLAKPRNTRMVYAGLGLAMQDEDVDRPVLALGLCSRDYQRKRRREVA